MKLKHLTGPRQALGHLDSIQTAADYLRVQDVYLAAQRRMPNFTNIPHEMPDNVRVNVYVNESRLLVDCACGSGVMVDLEFKLACCMWCGAIYREQHLVTPSDVEMLELDTLLGEMPSASRNFDPRRGHTVQLLREGM